MAHWDDTGAWRWSYFSELVAARPEDLSPALRSEREFVICEQEVVDSLVTSAPVVCDLGCGVGRRIWPVAEVMGSSRFAGFDLSFPQLSYALDRSNRERDNVVLVQGDLAALPARGGVFDLALLCNQTFGLIHGLDRQQVLIEIQRVLSKSSLLVLGGFTNVALASACYQEWGLSVRSVSEAGLVDVGTYRSLWSPFAEVDALVKRHAFERIEVRFVELGYIAVYAAVKSASIA